MPKTVSSNSALISSLLCVPIPSPFTVDSSARLDAAYLSIVEGFRRKPFVLGLSKVEADEPETNEGVRMLGGSGME